MMSNDMSIKEYQEAFKRGAFNATDVQTQCDAGWYDWFCRDSSLANKTKFLSKPIVKLRDSNRVNLNTMYVFFKNNMSTELYDDFRICDLETGDVLYTVTLREPVAPNEDKSMWTVYDVQQGLLKDEDDNEFYEKHKFATTRELTMWLNEGSKQ